MPAISGQSTKRNSVGVGVALVSKRRIGAATLEVASADGRHFSICRPTTTAGDFVQSDRFAGTSYRAANWTHVGQTLRPRSPARSPPRRCCRAAGTSAPGDRRRAGRAATPSRALGATAGPSVGAVPARIPGRCSPSSWSGRAPPRAACRAAAPPRERRWPAGRRPAR